MDFFPFASPIADFPANRHPENKMLAESGMRTFCRSSRKKMHRKCTAEEISPNKIGSLSAPYFVYFERGTPAWTRTKDQLIKSQLLYQLSYRGIGWNQAGYCSVTRCK